MLLVATAARQLAELGRGLCSFDAMWSPAKAKADYLKNHRNRVGAERLRFQRFADLDSAVCEAVMARDKYGKRHSHQRRIPKAALQRACRKVQDMEQSIAAVADFEKLHELLTAQMAPIRGIGPLAIYDAALRIGYYLRLSPARVYLHAGALAGAHKLHLVIPASKRIAMHALPKALQGLPAEEVEDILCIYFGSGKAGGSDCLPNGLLATAC